METKNTKFHDTHKHRTIVVDGRMSTKRDLHGPYTEMCFGMVIKHHETDDRHERYDEKRAEGRNGKNTHELFANTHETYVGLRK